MLVGPGDPAGLEADPVSRTDSSSTFRQKARKVDVSTSAVFA